MEKQHRNLCVRMARAGEGSYRSPCTGERSSSRGGYDCDCALVVNCENERGATCLRRLYIIITRRKRKKKVPSTSPPPSPSLLLHGGAQPAAREIGCRTRVLYALPTLYRHYYYSSVPTLHRCHETLCLRILCWSLLPSLHARRLIAIVPYTPGIGRTCVTVRSLNSLIYYYG